MCNSHRAPCWPIFLYIQGLTTAWGIGGGHRHIYTTTSWQLQPRVPTTSTPMSDFAGLTARVTQNIYTLAGVSGCIVNLAWALVKERTWLVVKVNCPSHITTTSQHNRRAPYWTPLLISTVGHLGWCSFDFSDVLILYNHLHSSCS